MITLPAEQVAEEETPSKGPSRVEVFEAIEMMKLLADDGDESAKEDIEALQLLLED
jgi:hypothetical protein